MRARSLSLWLVLVTAVCVSATAVADINSCKLVEHTDPADSGMCGGNGCHWGENLCSYGGGGIEPASVWDYFRAGEDLAANFSFNDFAMGLAMAIGYGVLPTTSGGVRTAKNDLSEPVNGDGEFTTDETDLSFPGFGLPYQFTRTYRSGAQFAGVLGFGWDHNYNQMILGSRGPAAIAPDQPLQRLTKGFPLYHTGAMQEILFDEARATEDYPSGELFYYSSSDPRMSAYQLVWSTANQRWTLTNLENGTISTFVNSSGAGLLNTVTGPTGGDTHLVWEFFSDGRPRVEKVIDTTGRTIIYNYQNGFLQCLSLSSGCASPLVSFAINSTDSTAADFGELTQVRKGNDSTGISYQYHHGALPVQWLPSAQIDSVCNGFCGDGTDSTCPDTWDMCVNMADQSLDVDANGNIDYSRCRSFCLALCIDACAPPVANQGTCVSNCFVSCPSTCNDARTYTGTPDNGYNGYYAQCFQRFSQKLPFCQAGLSGNTQGCLDSCKPYYAPPPAMTYAVGQPTELNHNLELITDGSGRTIIHNMYDPEPSHISFDKVIDQQWGQSQHVTFEYHDLALEKQYTGASAPSIPNPLLDTIDSFHSTALCSCNAGGNCTAPFDDTGSQSQSQSAKYATVTTDIRGAKSVQYFNSSYLLMREVNLQNGETKNYNYANGRLIGIQEPSGVRSCSVLDTVGHPLQVNRYPAPGYAGDQTSVQQLYSWNGALLGQYVEDSSSSSSISYQRLSDGRPYQINVAVDSATTQTTTLSYNGTFYPSSVTKNGVVTQYNAYDQNGAAPSVVITDANGPSPSVRYRSYDPTWGTVTFDALYDGSTDRGSTQATYDPAGRIATQTRHLLLNDAGFKTTYTYSATQQPSSVSDPKQTSLPIYDTNNNLINVMQWPTQPGDQTLGRRTCHHYDIDGRLLETIRPEGDSIIYHYDNAGRVTYVQKGFNPVQSSESWASGCAHEHAPPLGDPGLETIVSYTYQPGGFLQTFTQNGVQYQVSTDGFGRTLETIDPVGRRERRGLDHLGRLSWLARFDADPGVPPYAKPVGGEPGLVAMTEYTYDNLGRTTSTTRWRLENDSYGSRVTTTVQYLDDQQKVVIQDAPDRTIQLTYDGVGRLVSRVEPDGSTTTISYSSNGGHSTTTTQATSGTIVTERDFDGLGLLRTSVVNGQTTFSEPHYFDGTALTTTKLSEGFRTYSYDAFGRRKQTSLQLSPGGGGEQSITQTAFDGDDRVVSITDGNGRTTTSVYDGLDRVIKKTDPLLRSSTYHYVTGSKRLSEADLSSGNRQTFEYSPAGELALETTNVPGVPIDLTRSFTYTGIGQLHTATISGGAAISNTTTLEYDSLGNLSSDSNSLLPHSVWDFKQPYGNYRWRGVNGYQQTIGYDALRRVAAVAIFGIGEFAIFQYGSGGVGEATDVDFAYTSLQEVRSFDAQGRRIGADVSTSWGAFVASEHDSMGPDGIVRARQQQFATGGTLTNVFGVDAAGRVTAENTDVPNVPSLPAQIADDDPQLQQSLTSGSSAKTYQLDNVANPLSFSVGGTVADTKTFNGVNQIVSTSYPAGPPVYDSNDDLTQWSPPSGSESYSYDPFGHVTSILANGHDVEYTYDALGRRIVESHDGVLNYLAWYGQQLTEHGNDEDGYVIEMYGTGLDEHVAAWGPQAAGTYGSTAYPSAPDASVLAVSDGFSILESYSYSAFGESVIRDYYGNVLSGSSVNNRFMFQGQMIDPETGTYSMRAREYHPRLGRFLSDDPIGLVGGINLYAFAGGNPLAFRDPWGLSPKRIGVNDPNAMTVAATAGLMKAPLSFLALACPTCNQQINDNISNVLGYQVEGPIAGMTDVFSGFYTGVALDGASLALDPEVLSSVAASAVADSTGADAAAPSLLPSNTIRFSQSSVNDVAEITESMKANGWVGDPIDVVRMPDGALTSVDNTRVLAAARSGTDVQAVVHDASEALSTDMIDRFASPDGTFPSTWGDAVSNRIAGQAGAFRKTYPMGSWITGSSE